VKQTLNKVYFIGIGGIGMSALARYLNTSGIHVIGYDKTPTTLTKELENEGMVVHYDDRPDLIDNSIDLIIYTPAIPKDLAEYQKALNSGIRILKRSEFLEEITLNHETLAVAGTHGKTTISTMLAHILFNSSKGCTAFLGGIAKNYNSNLLLNHNSKFMVAEADEFDRSFLKLHPGLAVITSTDADHLDIYKDHSHLLSSFSQFAGNVVPGGKILIKEGIDLPLPVSENVNTYTYSINAIADFYISDLQLEDGKYSFTLNTPDRKIKGFNPALPGLFNVENSVAAASAAWLAGVSDNEIVDAVNSFLGVKRRFDHRVVKDDILYIDDYAHHPEELKACISSVRKLYPLRKITGIFQPHLYTRTRDFASGFAESLSLLDNLILLDIYPARELPIEGVTSQMLLELTPIENKILLKKEEVADYLTHHRPDILLTLGAGDIDQLVPVIEQIFK
jgi:UDP-N-acetylmuramate--alanine ligase